LLIDGEDVQSTDHPRVRVIRAIDTGVKAGWIEQVMRAADGRDSARLVELICEAVPEFTPSELVVPGGLRTAVHTKGTQI
jgi:hypothetical protein